MSKGMPIPSPVDSDTSDRELVAVRVFDAPRALVFRAWSSPERITRWWGPRGFTTTTDAMEFRPGGSWRHTMHGADGADYPNHVVYNEIVEPERIDYEHRNDDGESVHFRAIVTFEDLGDKTRLTMRMIFVTAEEKAESVKFGAAEGLTQTLDRLGEIATEAGRTRLKVTLPSDLEIRLTRVFDAPKALVYEAVSKPEHIPHWWGPRGTTFKSIAMDVRPGGSWRYVTLGPDGSEHPFRGVYREVSPPDRIVSTFIYDVDVIRDFEAVETISLEEADGRTTLTVTVLHSSRESRDGQLHSGMEAGAGESYDRLAELLETLNPKRHLAFVRAFDAPRNRVFQAWSDPDQLARWWGPHGFTNPVCEADAQPGGAIRIHMQGPDGAVYPMTGEFTEVVPPERLAFRSFVPGPDGRVVLETDTSVRFDEFGGQTIMTFHSRVVHVEGIGIEFVAGMAAGWGESLERLAGALARGDS